jgi:hypothetical protein
MRTTGWLLLLLGVVGGLLPASAQFSTSSDTVQISPSTAAPKATASARQRSGAFQRNGVFRNASLFYVADEATTLHNLPTSDSPVGRLPMRTAVTRLECGEKRCRVRTNDGEEGYVAATALSNVWIQVSKTDRRVYLYRGTTLVSTFEADMAYNSFADKKRNGGKGRRDHWRTPEGAFYVVHKNPESTFYKALVLNYPKVEDARRGLETGLISRSQYQAIKRAQEELRMPPMDTDLGGWIEIHGDGTGSATTWTQGCVAVRNGAMDVLWEQVRVGTPVLIE